MEHTHFLIANEVGIAEGSVSVHNTYIPISSFLKFPIGNNLNLASATKYTESFGTSALSNGCTTASDQYIKTTVLSQRATELYKLLKESIQKVQMNAVWRRMWTSKKVKSGKMLPTE